MLSSSRLRLLQTAAIAAVAVILVCLVAERPVALVFQAVVIGALVALVRSLIRDPFRGGIGFEAAVVLGAIIAFHDPAVALIAVAVGAGFHAFRAGLKAPQRTLSAATEAAQLALSYSIAALLYCEAVDRTARAVAKISGFVLLVIGCSVVELVFTQLRRLTEEDPMPTDLRQSLRERARLALAITPVVAVEVLLYGTHGLPGFIVGAIPSFLLAVAIRRQLAEERRNTELVRRNRELSILTENSTEIFVAGDDEETFRRLAGMLGKLASMKACAIVCWSRPDLPAKVYRFGECLPSDQDICRWVETSGLTHSAPSRAFVFQDEQRRFPLSSGRAVQVLIGIQTAEVIYGIVMFESTDATILKTERLNLLTLLVNQTAVSLQDQLLRREMQEKTRKLEAHAETTSAILELATGLIGTFDLDGALTRIAQSIRASLGFENVLVALLDPKRDQFVRCAQAGLDDVWGELRKNKVSSESMTALLQEQFRISRSYYVPGGAMQMSERDFVVKPDQQLARSEEWHENDQLIVPLLRGDELLGYLSVRGPRDRRVPTAETVRTLEIFGVQAAMAVQSARNYQQIERLTFIDALTPAFNYRYFQEALAKEIHRHGRSGNEFILAMLDIDNFKRVNDSFGHPIGDEVLKGLVDELLTKGRDSDVIARYGGEEFAIILPDTPSLSARDAANRLRELVERRHFEVPQLGRTLRITVSVGVAVYPLDGLTSADLIARADAALYLAKKHGKNRVAIAADLLPGQQFAL
jgi:diguanylate cyclase (GGDEF)-like protein